MAGKIFIWSFSESSRWIESLGEVTLALIFLEAKVSKGMLQFYMQIFYMYNRIFQLEPQQRPELFDWNKFQVRLIFWIYYLRVTRLALKHANDLHAPFVRFRIFDFVGIHCSSTIFEFIQTLKRDCETDHWLIQRASSSSRPAFVGRLRTKFVRPCTRLLYKKHPTCTGTCFRRSLCFRLGSGHFLAWRSALQRLALLIWGRSRSSGCKPFKAPRSQIWIQILDPAIFNKDSRSSRQQASLSPLRG